MALAVPEATHPGSMTQDPRAFPPLSPPRAQQDTHGKLARLAEMIAILVVDGLEAGGGEGESRTGAEGLRKGRGGWPPPPPDATPAPAEATRKPEVDHETFETYVSRQARGDLASDPLPGSDTPAAGSSENDQRRDNDDRKGRRMSRRGETSWDSRRE